MALTPTKTATPRVGGADYQNAQGVQTLEVSTNNFNSVDTSVMNTSVTDAANSVMDNIPPELRAQVLSKKNALVMGDINAVQKLGMDVALSSSKVSSKVSEVIKLGNAGEIGVMLNDMMKKTKSLDPSKLLDTREPGFFSKLFGRAKDGIETFKNNQSSVNQALVQIGNNLLNQSKKLEQNNEILKQMIVQNELNIKLFAVDIAAGHIRLKELQENELPALEQKARETGLQEDINAFKSAQNFVRQLEVRVSNLISSRAVALLTTPDLMDMINNNIMQCENINNMVVTAIPLWHTNINKYILSLQTRESVEQTNAMTEHINEGLKQAARLTSENSIMITEAVNKSIVKVETIEFMQNELLTTMEKNKQINQAGTEYRKNSAAKLMQMEQELKQKLLS